jgi:hypothetical protein
MTQELPRYAHERKPLVSSMFADYLHGFHAARAESGEFKRVITTMTTTTATTKLHTFNICLWLVYISSTGSL